jgi:hypothetical protein
MGADLVCGRSANRTKPPKPAAESPSRDHSTTTVPMSRPRTAVVESFRRVWGTDFDEWAIDVARCVSRGPEA